MTPNTDNGAGRQCRLWRSTAGWREVTAECEMFTATIQTMMTCSRASTWLKRSNISICCSQTTTTCPSTTGCSTQRLIPYPSSRKRAQNYQTISSKLHSISKNATETQLPSAVDKSNGRQSVAAGEFLSSRTPAGALYVFPLPLPSLFRNLHAAPCPPPALFFFCP